MPLKCFLQHLNNIVYFSSIVQDSFGHFFLSLESIQSNLKSNKHLQESVPFFSVDLVAKPYSVHSGQLKIDIALLQIIGFWAHLYLSMKVAGFLIFKCRIEKSVH